MNSRLAKSLYNLYCAVKNKPVPGYLEWLDETQYYPLSRLREIQLERLKRVVEYAYQHTQYYRREFDRLKITPDQLRSLENIELLPVLSKETVRNHYNELISKDHERSTYQNFTSGSTGRVLKFVRDADAAAWFWAAEYRGPQWHGWEIGDRYGFFWGVPLNSSRRRKERIKDLLQNRIRFSAHDLSESQAESFYQKCLEFKPEYFWGYPSAIYRFAKVLSQKNLSGSALNLKFIKSSSEMLHDFQVDLLESTFGCRVYNDYGACEVGHIAFECPRGGMHLSIENFFIEILDDNNEPVADGIKGKVVFTNLVNLAMPLIRYEIGDIASLSNQSCSCGRSLPLLNDLVGRTDDMVLDENGDVIHDSVLGYLIKEVFKKEKMDSVLQIRFIQRVKGELIAQIVKGPSFSDIIIKKIEKEIPRLLGSSFRIQFQFPDKIPVDTSGKFRYFISEISGKENNLDDLSCISSNHAPPAD
jgi:phenylacetate-CoA ligase